MIIRSVVLEDEPLLLRSIKTTIEQCDSEYVVIGSATDGKSGLSLISTLRPDVVFTDVCMPMMDGLSVVDAIRARKEDTLVVVISGYQDFEYAQRAIELGVSEYLVKPIQPDALKHILDKMKKELERRAKLREERHPDAADRLVEDLKEKRGTDASLTENIIRKIWRELNEQYMNHISIAKLAEENGLTHAYLIDRFRHFYDMAPNEFIISKRIAKAKELLALEDDLNIRDIAHMVGYEDPYYFSRLFKNEIGISPTEYRNANREEQTP